MLLALTKMKVWRSVKQLLLLNPLQVHVIYSSQQLKSVPVQRDLFNENELKGDTDAQLPAAEGETSEQLPSAESDTPELLPATEDEIVDQLPASEP
jgi:nuclear GTP-binding protein